MLKNLRCGECARLLCKAGAFDEIQIKCPRCGTLNHLKAESLTSDRRERIQEGSHHENQLLQGDALTILPTLEANSFDALITDPPYASGGLTAAARARPPSTKYCRDGGHADFVGDERDQRGHLAWMQLWLSECARL